MRPRSVNGSMILITAMLLGSSVATAQDIKPTFSDTEIVGGKPQPSALPAVNAAGALPKHYHNAKVIMLERREASKNVTIGSQLKLLLKANGEVEVIEEEFTHSTFDIGADENEKEDKVNKWSAAGGRISITLSLKRQGFFSVEDFNRKSESEDRTEIVLPLLSQQDVLAMRSTKASEAGPQVVQKGEMMTSSNAKCVENGEVVIDSSKKWDWIVRASLVFNIGDSHEVKPVEVNAAELSFIESACGSTDARQLENERENAKKDAKSLGSINISVNDKEFTIKIFEWDMPTAAADPGRSASHVYLPKGENYYQRGMRLANELGNLITDARDGAMDFSFRAQDDSLIGLLGSESRSDFASAQWASFQLGDANSRFPFDEYKPRDPASAELFNQLLNDHSQLLGRSADTLTELGESWSRAELLSGRDFYRNRARALQSAEDLVKDGKLREAYNLLLSEGGGEFSGYACKVLDSHRVFRSIEK